MFGFALKEGRNCLNLRLPLLVILTGFFRLS